MMLNSILPMPIVLSVSKTAYATDVIVYPTGGQNAALQQKSQQAQQAQSTNAANKAAFDKVVGVYLRHGGYTDG